MPSAFAHAIAPAAATALSRGSLPRLSKGQWVKCLLVAAILGNIPDIDLIPASLFQDRWADFHRAWGHNLFALTLFVSLGQWALRKFVSPEIPKKTAWIMASCLVLGHCVLDMMMEVDSRGRLPGIPIFYPFSRLELVTGLELFACTPIEPGINPIIGHLISFEFWTHTLAREILLSLGLSVVWLGLLSVARLWTRRSVREQAPHLFLDDLRRDVPRSTHHPAAGVTPGTAEVEALDRSPEVGVLR